MDSLIYSYIFYIKTGKDQDIKKHEQAGNCSSAVQCLPAIVPKSNLQENKKKTEGNMNMGLLE